MVKSANQQRGAKSQNRDGAGELNVAVVIHLFYEDQWEEFQDLLANLPQDFSLYVSLKPESLFGAEIRQCFPNAVVRTFPNIGRDVAPFLGFLPELQSHNLVCKLHSKRNESAHTIWRQEVARGLIGNKETVAAYLGEFAKDADLVLAGPRFCYVDGQSHVFQTKQALAVQHGPIPERWGFFAGTMFWFRPEIFAGLDEMYPPDAFVAHEDDEGHPEHVLERIFGLLVTQLNKKVMLWDGIASVDLASKIRGNPDFTETYERFKKTEYKPSTENSSELEHTLLEIHRSHRGFTSDKWSGNLAHYERIMNDFRNKEIRLLELGVQNGGSLQIWSKYFVKGRIFIGCDINEACAKLQYSDPRIKVVCCDAGTPLAKTKIMELCGQFDLIIDDGSHRSSDIIRAFIQYFPCVSEFGTYVVEDLHCSYWTQFEGGLDHAASSLAFFRKLTDVINREHWHGQEDIASLFLEFSNIYDLEINANVFNSIVSIEFINSMVIIRKGNLHDTLLGERIVSGTIAQVDDGVLVMDGAFCQTPFDNELRGEGRPSISGVALSKRFSISVVIPFYNGSIFLPDAIRSVQQQTQVAREIIVVDDGSSAQEANWLTVFSKDAGFKVITQHNSGQGGARNTGVKNATGSHICFLDQDDIFLPNHNEALIEHFKAVESGTQPLGWVFSNLSESDEDLNVISQSIFPYPADPIPQAIEDCLARDLIMFPSTTLIDRAAFLNVEGFDYRLRGYEDDDLFLRMFIAGYKTSFCPMDLVCWRSHAGQTSKNIVFLQSLKIFYKKWHTYNKWKDSNEKTFARTNLKARILRNLQIHFKRGDFDDVDLLWGLYRDVEQAR